MDDTDATPAPTRPRPKPRPTGKGRKKAGEDIAPPENVDINVAAQPERQTLTFEPGYPWDQQFDLDPTLDLAFDQIPQHAMDQILSPWHTTLPSSNLAPIPFTNPALIDSHATSSSYILAPGTPAQYPASTSFINPALIDSHTASSSLIPRATNTLSSLEIPEDTRHVLGKSPRRKADTLAIEEAQNMIVKGKRRR